MTCWHSVSSEEKQKLNNEYFFSEVIILISYINRAVYLLKKKKKKIRGIAFKNCSNAHAQGTKGIHKFNSSNFSAWLNLF